MNALLERMWTGLHPAPAPVAKPKHAPTTGKPATPAPKQRRGLGRLLRWAAVLLLVAVVAVAALWFLVLRPPLVGVVTVRRGNAVAEIEGTGTVTADALADIASKITGRVERVFVDQGDAVRQGQIIATLDETALNRQVDAARARLAGAQETAGERQREWVREKALVASGAVSAEDSQQYRERSEVAKSTAEATVADLGRAEYDLSLAQVPALSSGIVTKRWVVPGASVVAGQPMFTVADTDLIYVSAYIDQSDGGKLLKGQKASVILRGREDRPLDGYVLRISPEADAGTEEMVAEVAFMIPQAEFQLGQWATVYVRVADVKDALLVPGAALTAMDSQAFVFAVDPRDVIHKVPVNVIARSPRSSDVAVIGHLSPGERVVLQPMNRSPDETIRPDPIEPAKAPAMAP